MTLYDKHGIPMAYSDDNEYIYLFTGKPVAYFYENTVYGFNGHQFGWFENGWIRDLQGRCAFFSENTTGSGPTKPSKHVTPSRGARSVKPTKRAKHAKRAKAANSIAWSELSGIQFFNQ